MTLVLFSNIVFATEQSLGTFKQNTDALLIQTCSNCTFVNITTITLGDKTNLTLDVSMTKDRTFYYYTLGKGNLSSLGTYYVNGIADLDGELDIWSYKFEVTPIGLSQTTSQGIGSFAFLILMVVLMFIFGVIGFRLFKSDKWWVLGIFLVFLAGLLLVYNTWLGYQYHRLFTGLPDSSMPERIFWTLLMILVLGALVSIALLFLKWRKVLRHIKQEIKRKEPSDKDLEDWDTDDWRTNEFQQQQFK